MSTSGIRWSTSTDTSETTPLFAIETSKTVTQSNLNKTYTLGSNTFIVIPTSESESTVVGNNLTALCVVEEGKVLLLVDNNFETLILFVDNDDSMVNSSRLKSGIAAS